MRVIFDIHNHSKYARAVSKEMVPENLALWAVKKGIDVIATGDLTHPAWFKELKEKLEPAEPGLFTLKRPPSKEAKRVKFLLSGEISCIYSKGGKVRRIHHLVYAPSFEAAEKMNNKLTWIGNLKADGRPMLGLDSKKLLKILLEASPEAYLIPAHAWTPWFAIFGSKSGFDSLEECFEELTSHIFAIETGLSSDPAMNWRIPFLDDISIVSGSDAHSLPKLGREATVLDIDSLSYQSIFDAIKSRDPKRFLFTIEFFPEEGKYHYDGHRDVKHSQSPEETKEAGGKCKQCGRPVTVGVMARVEELAAKDRPEGYESKNRIPFKKLVPLLEIITEVLGVASATKAAKKIYEEMVKKIGSEFKVLLETSREEIISASGNPQIAQAVIRVREGKLTIEPGYDGEFGKVKIFEEGEKAIAPQETLF
ncbi:DNA helicase UvrD [Patescibacteria group bacterium]|nr:DNA helicase UvrD [Patescibacteria group bacterium]